MSPVPTTIPRMMGICSFVKNELRNLYCFDLVKKNNLAMIDLSETLNERYMVDPLHPNSDGVKRQVALMDYVFQNHNYTKLQRYFKRPKSKPRRPQQR